MKYLVTGATGTLGSEVVKSFIANQQIVKAGSRHPQKSKAQFGDQIEAVHFDFNDRTTFREADDADGVFLMEPPALDPNSYNLAVPFLDYLIRQRKHKLVYLSSHGMETLSEIPFHAKMEERVEQSGLGSVKMSSLRTVNSSCIE